MARRKKSKPDVGLVIVVDTENDDALDTVVEAAEGLVEELEDEVNLTVTFAANLPPAEDEEDDEPEVDDDDDIDDEEDDSDDSDDDSDDGDDSDDESDDGDDEEEVIDEDYLEALSLKELKEVAEEHGVEVKKGKKSATYIKEVLASLEEEEVEEDDDEEEEDDDYMTVDDLKKKKTSELKALAKDYGIKVRTSWGKSDIIDAIVEVAGEED